MKNLSLGKTAIAILIAAYCAWYIIHPLRWHFIDNVDLIVHEAGHWIFMPLGYFMSIAGGSLLQILVPAIFSGYFFKRGETYSGSLLLFWLGVSLANVAIYAKDALKMELPLLGGEGTIHDWNYLLTDLGWLRHTHLVAGLLLAAAIAAIIAALVLSLISARKPANEL